MTNSLKQKLNTIATNINPNYSYDFGFDNNNKLRILVFDKASSIIPGSNLLTLILNLNINKWKIIILDPEFYMDHNIIDEETLDELNQFKLMIQIIFTELH